MMLCLVFYCYVMAGKQKLIISLLETLLSNVKVHIAELMKVVFGRLSLNASLLHDVMGTIMAAILAELAFYSQDHDLAEGPELVALPPLSGWLLDILVKKKHILRYFLDELTDCCESGAISDFHKIHGTVHILHCVASSKNEGGLKELWTVIHKQMDTVKQGLHEEQLEDFRSVILSVEEKLKNCQELLNMEPS